MVSSNFIIIFSTNKQSNVTKKYIKSFQESFDKYNSTQIYIFINL